MKQEPNSSGTWRFLRWPLFMAFTVILFLVIGISTARETYRARQVNRETQGLQTQVEELETKQMHLIETIQRLSSDDDLDKQARARLGLRKPGERVIVLPEANGRTAGSQDSQGSSTSSSEPTLSNPQKWFRYFFPR
ncbi:MAG: septum formation initiator family protein [Candidatus Uhrbacteria bacterium]|nr:septum formation initiator family protein [Candidatus Uhrbacteria bacterium]MDP3793581.1 septum formation initiator family protein [Candidatus Uhrbacteria bacterium]